MKSQMDDMDDILDDMGDILDDNGRQQMTFWMTLDDTG